MKIMRFIRGSEDGHAIRLFAAMAAYLLTCGGLFSLLAPGDYSSYFLALLVIAVLMCAFNVKKIRRTVRDYREFER